MDTLFKGSTTLRCHEKTEPTFRGSIPLTDFGQVVKLQEDLLAELTASPRTQRLARRPHLFVVPLLTLLHAFEARIHSASASVSLFSEPADSLHGLG